MKNLTLTEYTDSFADSLYSIIEMGDILRVDCGNGNAFVAMEEAEYKVMRDALETLLTNADKINIIEKIGGII